MRPFALALVTPALAQSPAGASAAEGGDMVRYRVLAEGGLELADDAVVIRLLRTDA